MFTDLDIETCKAAKYLYTVAFLWSKMLDCRDELRGLLTTSFNLPNKNDYVQMKGILYTPRPRNSLP